MVKNTFRMIVVGAAAVFVYGSAVFAAPAAGAKDVNVTENAVAATVEPDGIVADNAVPEGFSHKGIRNHNHDFAGKDKKAPHAKAPDVHNRNHGDFGKGKDAPYAHVPKSRHDNAHPDFRAGKRNERAHHSDGRFHGGAHSGTPDKSHSKAKHGSCGNKIVSDDANESVAE